MKISQATLDAVAEAIKKSLDNFMMSSLNIEETRVKCAKSAITAFCKVDEVRVLLSDVDEYLHWRKVNRHIKGGENYLKRLEESLAPFTDQPQNEDAEKIMKSPRSELTEKEHAQPNKQPPKQETARARDNGAAEATGVRLGETHPGDTEDPWDNQWEAYKQGKEEGYNESLSSLPRMTKAELIDLMNNIWGDNAVGGCKATAIVRALIAKLPHIVKE